MTVAVLLPDRPGTPEGALADQARRAGVTDVRIDPAGDASARLGRIAALAGESRAPLLLCATDVVAQDGALRFMLTEPGAGAVALVGDPADAGAPARTAVREERGVLVAAGPAGTPGATGSFLGVLRVGVPDLPALARAAERLAADGAAGASEGAGGGAAPVVDRLLPELLRAGVRVGACRVRPLVAARVGGAADVEAVRARMAGVDEDAARLRLAVKAQDDFFTTHLVSPISPYVVRWAARVGLSPTAVTGVSVALATVAAAGFAWGARPAMIGGAVLLYVSFLLDCVDGQLARYTRRFSAVGGWLDTMADRSKEYLVYAGLAIGAERAGLGPVWPLAVAAITLQTVRHMTDAWYGALHDEAVARRARAAPASGAAGTPADTPAGTAADTPAGTAAGASVDPAGDTRRGIGVLLGRASERVQADTGSPAYWLKRIVVFPIGERWALIALTAALFDGRVALGAVLVWGGLAAAYTLALRSLRARSMRVPVMTTVDAARHRDDGPLARALSRLAGPGGAAPPLPMTATAAAVSAGLVVAAATGTAESRVTAWVAATAVAVLLLAGLPAAAPHARPLDWLVPAALRAVEYLFAAGASVAAGVPLPLLFVLLFALALRHYDRTARMEKGAAAGVARPWDIGWDGRVTLLAAGVAVGVPHATVAVLAGYLVVMFSLGAPAAGRTASR